MNDGVVFDGDLYCGCKGGESGERSLTRERKVVARERVGKRD